MDQSGAPPPVPHTLRPHHAGILLMLIVYYRGVDYQDGGPPHQLHPKVKMRMLRLLAREIGEMKAPTPYRTLVGKIVSGYDDRSLKSELALLKHTLNEAPNVMRSPEVLGDLFSDARNLVAGVEDLPEDTSCILERRSFLGLFVRRCFLSFRKLSFAGQVRLHSDFSEWCEGKLGAGYHLSTEDRRRGLQIYPVIFDLHELSKPDQFEQFEASQKTGDSKSALDSLRRFYDQRFALSDDSVLYQHSLLSMAELHYNQGEHRAARHFLDEAIKIARERNDTITLGSCQSLMQRISPDPGTLFIARDRTSTVKAGMSPLEVLWEIKRLLDLGEGLQLAFIKVSESMGVWDAKWRSNLGIEKWPKHAVLAILWKLAGIETLAQCHESIIRAFTQAGDDDSRMAAICSQASRYNRQGSQSKALRLLLDPQTWRGLSFSQYSLWAREVWNVFSFTTARKGQKALHREFLLPNQPSVPPVTQSLGVSSPYQSKTVITESLRLAMQYKDAGQTVAAIKPLMEAIWSAEFRGTYSYYRIAVVLLADVGLELGLAHSGRALIEEVLPQLLLGDDLELRAYASLTYARCIIAGAGADVSETKLKECRPHLIRAIKDYKIISKYEKALEALYTFSVVCHNLRTFGERDSWAGQFITLDEERKAAARVGVTEETREVFRVITEVAYVVGQEQ